MSYSILYKRLFIKLPSGRILPLIQAGDNNVYDVKPNGREVRSRDWEVWAICRENGRPSVTSEEIADWLNKEHERAMLACQRAIQEGYGYGMSAEKNFGYFRSMAIGGRGTAGTTWGMFKNFFVDGVKKAIPLEEFVKACGKLRITWYHKEADKSEHRSYQGDITTERELEQAWADATAGANDGGPWVSPAAQWKIDPVADLVWAGVSPDPRKNTVLIVTLEDRTTGYLKTVYPFTYTQDKAEARVFSMKALRFVSILRAIPEARSACYDGVLQ